MGLALITVVGQCVGAEEWGQVRLYTKKLVKLTYLCTWGLNAALLLGLPLILGLYSLTPETRWYASVLICIHNGCAMLFWPLAFTMPNALRAAGDVRVPMAVSIVFIAPLCNKFGKRLVTVIGMIVGVVGGVLAGIFYDNMVVAAVGIALKCLGSAPAGYMILAMIADCIDHIEAKTGKRCDSLIMSIYSSIMIASMPVGQGITNALVGSGETGTVIAYIWIETVCYAVGAIVLVFFTVERYLEGDRRIILDRQKAQAEAAGVEWIPPEERLRREEEEADRLAEEARIAELKARCQKKGLNFEEEEAAYQAKLAAKQNKKK